MVFVANIKISRNLEFFRIVFMKQSFAVRRLEISRDYVYLKEEI